MEHWAELADKCDGVSIYRDFFRYVYQRPDTKLCAALAKTATDEQCVRYGIMAQSCLDFDCREELCKIKCPVIVIGSDHDEVLGSEISRTLAEQLNCELFMYHNRDFGHAVCDEAPDFKPRMMEFFHSID